MSRILITSLLVLATAAGATAKVKVLVDEDFESGLGTWTAMVQPVPPPPTEFDDSATLIPADGISLIKGPNTGFLNSKCAGFSHTLAAADGTTVEWLQRQFPNAVPMLPGETTRSVILFVDMDRYVYCSTATGSYQFGNRLYVLTKALYNDPMWGGYGDYDGNDPIWVEENNSGARATTWTTSAGGNTGGTWVHTHWDQSSCSGSKDGAGCPPNPLGKVSTTDGNVEIRLVQFSKNMIGDTSTLWDNVHISLYDYTGGVMGAVLWELNETFEGYATTADLTAVWTPMIRPSEDPNRPNNNAPMAFVPNDPLLYPGSSNVTGAAGYSSNLAYTDTTTVQWIQRQFPGALLPGTYPIHFEADRYIYKDLTANPGTQAVGNAICILTNSLYDDPNWDEVGVNPETTQDGFRRTVWNETVNGSWDHFVLDDTLTTTTGNLELRLLINDKTAGKQAVAWDNVKLWVTLPCNAPRFDLDSDGDVDMVDFAAFQRCMGTIDNTDEDCRCMNADGNTVIDLADLPGFTACASASGVPADPTCDDALSPP